MDGSRSETLQALLERASDLLYRYRLRDPVGFEYVSPSALAITGYTPEEHYADPELGFKLVHPDDRPLLERAVSGLSSAPLLLRWVRKDGRVIWTELHNVLVPGDDGAPLAIEGVARDVTEREETLASLRSALEANERLVIDLHSALQRVRTLSGLLPICAHCKKIRSDTGYWERIEHYISEHTEAKFTHGICPECEEKYFPSEGSQGPQG